MIKVEDFNDELLVMLYRSTKNSLYLETLMVKYTPFINKVLNKMYNNYKEKYSREDIKQEISIIFIDIVKNKFDLNRGYKFFTYTYKALQLSSLRFIRDDRYFPGKRDDRLKHLSNVIGFWDLGDNSSSSKYRYNSEADIIDTAVFSNYKRQKNEDDKIMYNLVLNSMGEILTDYECNVMTEHLVNDKTQTDIAKIFNVNQVSISKTIATSLEKMRKHWN